MSVLFLGEGEPDGPARYFLAIARWSRWRVDHCVDGRPIPVPWLQRRYDVIVLSDYRHQSFTVRTESWLAERVTLGGAGFLMIGGWASFTGRVGGYAGTLIESLLPVRCVPGDDRVNHCSGALLTRRDRSAWRGLDWVKPPIVCGFHKTILRPGTKTLCEFSELSLRTGQLQQTRSHPGLVTGLAGLGRTAAFLTDCAPHWAGGLVDWGRHRVTVPLSAQNRPELGDSYLSFFVTVQSEWRKFSRKGFGMGAWADHGQRFGLPGGYSSLVFGR